MPIRPGDLRQRVTIRRQTGAQNVDGGFDTSWQDVATVWAQVTGLNGREAVIGQALQGISYYRIALRFGADVTDSDQLRYGGIDLNIRSVSDPDGRREQLLILADTGSAQKTS